MILMGNDTFKIIAAHSRFKAFGRVSSKNVSPGFQVKACFLIFTLSQPLVHSPTWGFFYGKNKKGK